MRTASTAGTAGASSTPATWPWTTTWTTAGAGRSPCTSIRPVTHTKRRYTYRELRDEVAKFAGALRDQGVEKGDRVIIYMPMIPEAVISMLACARLGAVHSVVFGGFAPHELAVRIDDAKPKVLITASCGIEFTKVIDYKPLVDAALEEAEHPPELGHRVSRGPRPRPR